MLMFKPLLLGVLLNVATTADVVPPSGGSYVMTRLSIAAGGLRTGLSGSYSLINTNGQSIAGRATGGSYVLDAGFHRRAMADQLFKNGFE
jgi:hypothetical protein